MHPAGITTCALVALMLTNGSSLAQLGDLDPPAGPVAGIGPSLDEIDGRIAISAENTPGDGNSVFKITESGSYYLTGNVAAPTGFHGIEVSAADVSIDLNGYTIAGQPGSLDGVSAPNSDGMRVSNGRVRGVGGNGVRVRNEFHLHNLMVMDITGGDALACGGNNSIGDGFVGIIERCVINEVSGASNSAIDASCCMLVRDCEFSLVFNNYAIRAAQGTHVRHCTFNNLQAGAIRTDDDSSIVDCHFEFSTTSNGTAAMILVTGSGSLIRGNKIDAVAYDVGIQVDGNENLVEGNHVVGRSITSTGTRNVIIGNTVDTAIVSTAGDIVGPTVTSTAGLATAPASANIQY